MKQSKLVMCVLVVVFSLVFSLTGKTAAPEQTTSQIYWGSWISNNAVSAPYDYVSESQPGILGQFESRTQKKVSIIHWGQAWMGRDGQFNSFYPGSGNNPMTPLLDRARAHGAIGLIDWASQRLGSGTNQPEFTLKNITNGNFDAYITQWASEAAAYGYPFFIRFNWEMNGGWFPWGTKNGTNGNTPQDYVNSWRHVVDIFNSQGATNVTWVWCPNFVLPGQVSTGVGTNPNGYSTLLSHYPGDEYVDWTCIDGYNFAQSLNTPWQTFTQIFMPTYEYFTMDTTFGRAIAPTKPVMIGETATDKDVRAGDPVTNQTTKPYWISNALVNEIPANFPKIQALVWFNWNDNECGTDYPIEGSLQVKDSTGRIVSCAGNTLDQASIDAFSAGIRSSYYAPNSFGSLPLLQKIQPLTAPVSQPTAIPNATPTPIPQPTAAPVTDTTLPIVSITSPVARSIVARNTTVAIRVNASDNLGMRRVEMVVTGKGGNFSCSDTTAPYACNWTVPAKPNTVYTIKATAFDTSGNSSITSIRVTSSN